MRNLEYLFKKYKNALPISAYILLKVLGLLKKYVVKFFQILYKLRKQIYLRQSVIREILLGTHSTEQSEVRVLKHHGASLATSAQLKFEGNFANIPNQLQFFLSEQYLSLIKRYFDLPFFYNIVGQGSWSKQIAPRITTSGVLAVELSHRVTHLFTLYIALPILKRNRMGWSWF